MSLVSCKKELLRLLKEPLQACRVVVMPDYFMDRLINLEWDNGEFSKLIAEVANRKGGSIDGIPQLDMKGGNAINMASALASIGAEVVPIICTSELGLQQIKFHFKDTPIDLSHIKVRGKASITTALEFKAANEKTNVMLRDLGALASFGPDDLEEGDYGLMEKADYTCLFNWAGTLRYGTELADTVFGRVKRAGRCKTYYDTADPNPNVKAIPDFIERVLKGNKIDILSLNENEAITYASHLDPSLKQKRGQVDFAELAMESARLLAQHFFARIDLHTSVFSATVRRNSEVVVPAFKVDVLRATGAGDAWNAGNLLADHNGLSDECRLLLANALSACYLTGVDGMHPKREQLVEFLEENL
jgi:ribokinase